MYSTLVSDSNKYKKGKKCKKATTYKSQEI